MTESKTTPEERIAIALERIAFLMETRPPYFNLNAPQTSEDVCAYCGQYGAHGGLSCPKLRITS